MGEIWLVGNNGNYFNASIYAFTLSKKASFGCGFFYWNIKYFKLCYLIS